MLARSHIALFSLSLLVGVAGLAYAYLSLRPLEVAVAPVASNVPVRVFGLGTVEARVVSRIGFEVGAAIAELNADHGDAVKQGQVLAKLHSTQQKAKVARTRAAIKKLLSNAKFLLPVHDRPAKVEGSQIVGRLQDAVPGPLTQSLAPRNWFPA